MPSATPAQLPMLHNKRIVLGVTGGIAAYKSAELLRRLLAQGAQVQVVMTEAACEFVQPLTFQALSGRPVHVAQWSQTGGQRGMPHIDLGRWADVYLIAPCSANTLAKLANGLADNLLENLLLARNCPAAIAPAMNVEMWNNPATQRNSEQLRADGYGVFGPGVGDQACGETGAGRMLEPDELVLELARFLSPQRWAGQTVVLTAGPTQEPIDPVRAITNHSSGKMGYSLATAAWLNGATVHLISGPTGLAAPYGIETQQVTTAKEMHAAVIRQFEQRRVDLFLGVAAVADYAVTNPSEHKQKKDPTGAVGLHIEFELNPDILAAAGQRSAALRNPTHVVGFAAETQDLSTYAQQKLVSKKAHFMVGNLAQNAMGADHNRVHLFAASQTNAVARLEGPKLSVSLQLLEHLAELTDGNTLSPTGNTQ